ncbi:MULTISPECIES: hypothetical protein [unclassified Caballeronia]|uniref:hypothetical protein n=1 Tax=unclassified Caballeronia TaxID=2646786 RepID=UPI00285D2E60|nr:MULTISPECIES: hypothetical protein [unclassified Caballeronia]MDR5750364.1 hypothetical protein [Caballeronia sp. LZ024]MDR5842604.1 hypothetical protein [Caballeronia sp. LZ031]
MADDYKGVHDTLSEVLFESLTLQYMERAYIRDGIGGVFALNERIAAEARKYGWGTDAPLSDVTAQMSAHFVRELDAEYFPRTE